jgi:hypothetical protein
MRCLACDKILDQFELVKKKPDADNEFEDLCKVCLTKSGTYADDPSDEDIYIDGVRYG